MPNINELEHIKKKSARKRIVFVSGNFNIIHPGHLRLLRFAKECGDYLVVGILDDKAPGSFVDEKLRLEGLQAIAWVDYAFILRETPVAFIEKLKPAFVVKGKEHEERKNPEKNILQKYGGKLLFSSGEISFSSIDLMNAEWKELSISSIKKPADFPKRHQFSFNELIEISDRMKGLKICVLGDTIVDEYITCDALGMSQEDPTIVVTPVAREKFIGGAGIVALHARGLGADVHFFSVVGKDETYNYVRKRLDSQGVHIHLFQDESRPTTLKQRFRARQKTLLRVSHLRQHSIPAEIREQFYKEIAEVLSGIDLVIFSDFNYGCLPQTLVDQVTEICEQKKIMMVADSQSSSQIGDVSRFKKMTLVTPTEREARFNTAPKDVSGAGDSFLTCTSMAMAVGADIWKSSYLGSLAAACQIGRVGNIPLTPKDIKAEINGFNLV